VIPTMNTSLADRLEIHNAGFREDAARAGLCGSLHLPTGRVCLHTARHPGPCEFSTPSKLASRLRNKQPRR
jgi:hypothetical protein